MIAAHRPGSVGRELERVRLEHRARRVALVMSMLERRREERHELGVPVPPALTQAIGGFEAELRALDERLSALGSRICRGSTAA